MIKDEKKRPPNVILNTNNEVRIHDIVFYSRETYLEYKKYLESLLSFFFVCVFFIL
jgi:hypothetical protein